MGLFANVGFELDVGDDIDHTHHFIAIGFPELKPRLNGRQKSRSGQPNFSSMDKREQMWTEFLDSDRRSRIAARLVVWAPRVQSARAESSLDQLSDVVKLGSFQGGNDGASLAQNPGTAGTPPREHRE